MTRKKASLWSWSTGERGKNRVRVCERRPGGVLFLEVYDPSVTGRRPKVSRMSLQHTDREAAKQRAEATAHELRTRSHSAPRDITLGELFDIYEREVTPTKGEMTQRHDRRVTGLFIKAWGADRTAKSLNRRDWDAYIRERRAGRLRPDGIRKVRQLANRSVEQDLKLLLAILNWAKRAGDGQDGLLLDRNPLEGLPIPREENPRRPILLEHEYQQLLGQAAAVAPLFECLLILTHETGHRSRSIRYLHWSDVDFAASTIRWEAKTDKIGYEHITPLSDASVMALERARALSGHVEWVFPSPTNPHEPVRRELIQDWWNEAEKRAGVVHVPGRGFHSLRRKFATELRHLPLKDLQQLGGWKDHNTILKCYQQPDMASMREGLKQRLRLAS